MPRDANGSPLDSGDSVTILKDLKVKGVSSTLKRGTMVKNIRLNGNDDEIEAKLPKLGTIVLKTCFVKKA